MKTFTFLTAALFTCGIVLATGAPAFNQEAAEENPTAQDQLMENDLTQDQQMQNGQTQDPQMQNGRATAEGLLGQQIFDSNGEEIGEIERVAINRQNGQVSHVLIGVGGMLGMGETAYLIPWSQLSQQQNGYALNITLDQLEEAPELAGTEINEQAIQEADQFWQNR